MSEPMFTAYQAWSGGWYELAIEVGPRSDARMRSALSALWAHPDLTGCFYDRYREPDDQPRVPAEFLDDGAHLLGFARLPNGTRVTCGSCIVREIDDGSDWLDFYLPLGSLGSAYPVGGFPFGTEADWPGPWRDEVEDWLAEVGLRIAGASSFRLGLIGFDVSGHAYAADIAVQGIPSERVIGYLWPTDGAVVYHRRSVE